MRKELVYVNIEGAYGGNQNWFDKNRAIKLAGCSAISACEASIYLAANHPHLQKISPFKSVDVTKEDFMKFVEIMKSFICPLPVGVPKLSLFHDRYLKYAKSVGVELDIDLFHGDRPYLEAAAFLKSNIDAKRCILFLLLRHKNKEIDHLTWHWFTITGYEEREEGLSVIFSSWGKRFQIPFRQLWETGYKRRGGMIVLK